MKKFAIAISLVALALPAGAASLTVNGTAAIEGSFGAEVTMDGVVDTAYVLDETPNDETIYRADFKFDWNDLSYEYCAPQASPALKQRYNHAIGVVWDLDGATPSEKQFITLFLKCNDDGTVEPRPIAWVRTYDPTHPDASGTGALYKDDLLGLIAVSLPKASQTAGWPVTIRLEYQQASAPGANDGMVRICRANNFAPTTFSCKTQSALRQSTRNVDRFMWGATGGTDDGTTGSYFLDSFESYRTLAP